MSIVVTHTWAFVVRGIPDTIYEFHIFSEAQEARRSLGFTARTAPIFRRDTAVRP